MRARRRPAGRPEARAGFAVKLNTAAEREPSVRPFYQPSSYKREKRGEKAVWDRPKGLPPRRGA